MKSHFRKVAKASGSALAIASLGYIGYKLDVFKQPGSKVSFQAPVSTGDKDMMKKFHNDPRNITRWKSPSRDDMLTKLQEDQVYDLLIIGGGATGTGVALDAASRGLSVAMVERDDFSSGNH